MNSSQFDVVVVGAGAAGLSAAIGLARNNFRVLVLEAAAYPGAENWSGCVYFAENLAHPDLLGPEGVEALAWERRVVERGFFATDGHGLFGMTYRDPVAFRNCYTVLRPIYDHHLAQVAQRHGAVILSSTTAESLIREGDRVIGVATQRGPVYADLVFLAEGDASHLVTREGYETSTDPRDAPKFLQGIKQVIDLPPGAIEDLFRVGQEEGVAYELLLRNGTLRGKAVHLNMGGFLYTNRQSLSVGLVLPADNLHEHFGGDPNLLLEWFENLPSLRPWLRDGRRGVFGAKIIRGGGARDIPQLIDHGLAIGGAASAIGVDFPYPNFTGPATAMGLLLARAAVAIRARGGRYSRDDLERHYLQPLQTTHYWQDVEFLRRWPGYVKKTTFFFDRNLDLALGSVHIWTRPHESFLRKWVQWLRMLRQVINPSVWGDLRADVEQLNRALRVREVQGKPPLSGLLLDGITNALRDLFGQPRSRLPEGGHLQLHHAVMGSDGSVAAPPAFLRRWFDRFRTVLAAAARQVYRNDDTPLSLKLPRVMKLLVHQINLFDVMGGAGLLFLSGLYSASSAVWSRLRRRFGKGPPRPVVAQFYEEYATQARRTTDLTPTVPSAAQAWDARLATLGYHTVKASHIHVLWPLALPERSKVTEAGLWHVCPAHVYEARMSTTGQLQLVVNFENCIKCETCWRTSELVDWGRDGLHRFIYPVVSPALPRLLQALDQTGLLTPPAPRRLDPWNAQTSHGNGKVNGELTHSKDAPPLPVAEVLTLLSQLARKLVEFEDALTHEPRTLDRSRLEYLEMLTRYAEQLALQVVTRLREAQAPLPLLTLATQLGMLTERRARRTWDQKFAWAAADGRQIRQHHLPGLRALLGPAAPAAPLAPLPHWLRTLESSTQESAQLAHWRAQLDEVLGSALWRELEQRRELRPDQEQVLRALVATIPPRGQDIDALAARPRKTLLAELGRRDPSLAYRVAHHLWARDVGTLAAASPAFRDRAASWQRADRWACLVVLTQDEDVLLVPAIQADDLVIWRANTLLVVEQDDPGLEIEPLGSLGLRGAGLARVRIVGSLTPICQLVLDHATLWPVAQVLTACDLISIARGMTSILLERALTQATSRVQFPGLFHDEQARDPIGKFGAIKRMIAEIGARHYLLETLDDILLPVEVSADAVELAQRLRLVASEVLGPTPGSVAYNAGQIFGGTGFSEDDILSKYYRDATAWRFLGPVPCDVRLSADPTLLALCPGEELLTEVRHRRALHLELEELESLQKRLCALTSDWHSRLKPRQDADGQQLYEALARQEAYLVVSKALLLRTHARLEAGLDSEQEVSLLRVWLDEVAFGLHSCGDLLEQRLQATHDHRPLVEPGSPAPCLIYADYLKDAQSYDSGDFLLLPIDLVQPRLVPEMLGSDPSLAECDRTFYEEMQYFATPRDGLIYERFIEQAHRPSEEDLAYCREHNYFRMPIPRELGGEARRKLEYYLLVINTQRYADVAVSLTIQVNSSLGTTPILVARDKDLPKAQKEVAPFVGDPALQQEVATKLGQLEALLTARGPVDPAAIKHEYVALHKRLGEAIFSRAALRTLTHRFGEAWSRAGTAGLAYDLPTMANCVSEARQQWQLACQRAEEFHQELRRRREACALAMRWIAAGHISGFALTEPSAGSDTARVATRAVLRSVPVVQTDGVLSFTPVGMKESRYLVDVRGLDFRPDGVFYRPGEGAEAVQLHFEEYDYETDDPARTPYYVHQARRIPFTDIAQLRERDGQLWYDYWELTGAKMWITNGRFAGLFCLYAKTEEGITGFIVDRHAEGLLVGKDEVKMGQCGSPTNELSLQRVRVPRENVLGLEGRGQVNALETLNVGRAGLAMSSMSQMLGLLAMSRAHAEKRPGGITPAAAWRLQRMEEERFTAEALAFDIIGRFEHPQTRSIRLESAIAKMYASEALHRVITLAEEIHGAAGQTQEHLVEKRRRDARVLNIYEGTNEIQRFFILRDVAAETAARWARQSPTAPKHGSHEVLELEATKAAVRQRFEAALGFLGQTIWQNPNLQANCFLLAEAVAWLKAAESTLARVAWLVRREENEEGTEDPVIRTGQRAFARCLAEVRRRLHHFDEELPHLKRGFYAPQVRAAELLFARQTEKRPPTPPASTITRDLAILVVVEPGPGSVPRPHVDAGTLLEPYWTLNEADRAALEMALRVRDQAEYRVRLTVATVGSPSLGHPLREVLSLGIEQVHLVLTPEGPLTSDSAATALAHVLASRSFDLVLGGTSDGGEEGLLARLTAESLGVPFQGRAAEVILHAGKDENTVHLISQGFARARPLPCALAMEAGLPLRSFTMQGFLAGLTHSLQIHRWPSDLVPRPVRLLGAGGTPSTQTERPPHPLTPTEAAAHLLELLGLQGGGAAATSYEGPIVETESFDSFAPHVLAVLAADDQGKLGTGAPVVLETAARIAQGSKGHSAVLLLTSAEESSQRHGIAQVLQCYQGPIVLLPLPEGCGSPEVRSRLLQDAWEGLPRAVRLIVGEAWTEEVFARLSRRKGRADPLAVRVHRVEMQAGRIVVETRRLQGKVTVQQEFLPPLEGSGWLSLAEKAEIVGGTPLSTPVEVRRLAVARERFARSADLQRLLAEVKEVAGVVRLADAEFIVDVGFGVGNRDGYEAVIEPLEKALREAGVSQVVVGGSRKVTEELHLLPLDRQIGQSGVSVNPRILLAIGVSGAPQHLNYIGPGAIILAFNRDSEAPIMTLNQRQARPRVYPVVGDLFETIPALIAALKQEGTVSAEMTAAAHS